MMGIGLVVEGQGDVEALPVLLRRLAAHLAGAYPIFQRPVRVSRSKLVKPGELENAVAFAAATARGGPVFVVIDADDDCPAELGPMLLHRARTVAAGRYLVEVVLARYEFENWFLAGAVSLSGRCGLSDALLSPSQPEEVRDAKGWLRDRMADPQDTYSETLDQPKLANALDLDAARSGSASFDKLCRAFQYLLAGCSSEGK